MPRLRLGALSIYIEPRDLWVGVYVAANAVYVCPMPMLVFRWQRIVAGHFNRRFVKASLRHLHALQRQRAGR